MGVDIQQLSDNLHSRIPAVRVAAADAIVKAFEDSAGPAEIKQAIQKQFGIANRVIFSCRVAHVKGARESCSLNWARSHDIRPELHKL